MKKQTSNQLLTTTVLTLVYKIKTSCWSSSVNTSTSLMVPNEGAKLYHGRAYPVPHSVKETFMKEIKRLGDLGVKKKPWKWTEEYQKAFNDIKATIPDYSKGFEIYTDGSKRQLGAVITQINQPIAFFSRKLSVGQQKYSITEIELLAIVETLKEFKAMLWGQSIEVYTVHKTLMQDALSLTCDRWRLLLEEYGPESIYIKGIHSTVADAISRLDFGTITDVKENWMTFTKFWCYYSMQAEEETPPVKHSDLKNFVFANCSKENVIYPPIYGKLPTKFVVSNPWEICVELTGPYTFKGKDGTEIDFMCVTMIDPATSWFEIVELPVTEFDSVTPTGKKGRKGTNTHNKPKEAYFDKSSAQVGSLVNKIWFSHYPRCQVITYDNGSEFKLNFETLCESYGTPLGEKLQAMSSVKAIPEGVKWVECERGIGGKNSPVRYIPEQDPVQDALEKNKKTTYFKLTLPNTGNKLKVAVWASGTPEQFLLHVRSAIHACKQMGLDTSFDDAEKAVKTAKLDSEITKEEYTQLRNTKKKKKGNKGDAPGTSTKAVSSALAEAKALYNKALKALEAVKLAVTTAGAKPSELYGNLLSDEAHQPWEKIIKAQVTRAPWEDIKGVTHMETPTKIWDTFHERVTFHPLQVFRHDGGEALKYYTTNTLKKPNRVSIRQFFVQVEQLNSYLETLPCLYNSPKANQATKKILPLDDADLATHLLSMCPAKW
eukprot:CCRYP_010028-RA/>CCRYP_010028-RA protein AED:0.35 eAED:0.68 QI:0/0/0/1/0/0/6/0/715